MEWWRYLLYPAYKSISALSRLLSKTYRTSRALEGTWDYECILIGLDRFPEGGNAHGGTCTIKLKKTLLTTQIEVKGKRTWDGNKDHTTGELTKKILHSEKLWQSEEGSFVTNSRVSYKYSIDGQPIEGITTIDLHLDGKGLNPTGLFYYLPDEKQVNREMDYYSRIRQTNTAIVGYVLRSTGHVYLTNRKE